MTDLVERLRHPARYDIDLNEAADEIERLRSHNAALIETVRASLCPYNGRATGVIVAECQQCGCTSGLMIRERGRQPFDPAKTPGHTDMMVPPESLDAFMEANPLPDESGTLAGNDTALTTGKSDD